ncbi:MAG: hypothetical protein NVS3B26_14040 [Mycobacteriales bacterium]
MVSSSSAERNRGLLRPRELAQLREFGQLRYADTGTVVAASGSGVTREQVVTDGELELRARWTRPGRRWPSSGRAASSETSRYYSTHRCRFDAIASRDTELITLSRQRRTHLLSGSPDLARR